MNKMLVLMLAVMFVVISCSKTKGTSGNEPLESSSSGVLIPDPTEDMRFLNNLDTIYDVDENGVWIFDDGGRSGTYSSNVSAVVLFRPATKGDVVVLDLRELDLEDCCDFLSFNGETITQPGIYVSESSNGVANLSFESDGSATAEGFVGIVFSTDPDNIPSLLSSSSSEMSSGLSSSQNSSSSVITNLNTINMDDGLDIEILIGEDALVVYDDGGPFGNYSYNVYSTLNLQPETAGQVLRIEIISLSLESCCDYLSLNSNYAIEGSVVYTTLGNPGATLSWSSDGSVTYRGFEVRITSIDPADVPSSSSQSSSSSLSSSSSSSSAVSSSSQQGTIANPIAAPDTALMTNSLSAYYELSDTIMIYDNGGPLGSYSNSISSNINIQPAVSGQVLKVEILSLNRESCCDYLRINSVSRTTTGVFYTTSSSPSAAISFTSDGSVTSGGFEIRITTIDPADVPVSSSSSLSSSSLSSSLLSSSSQQGTVGNPIAAPDTALMTNNLSAYYELSDVIMIYDNGGPTGNYSSYISSSINVQPAVSGQVLKVEILSLNRESCCDYLRINSVSRTTTGVFYTTIGSPDAIINFTTDGSVTNTGFEIRITTIDPADVPVSSSSSLLISSSSVSSSSSIASSSSSWVNLGCVGVITGPNEFCDERDGQVYATTTIGTQTWMAENLNFAGAGACYNNAPSCKGNGRLYTYAEASGGAGYSAAIPSGIQGLCPTNWHLASNSEWAIMEDFIAAENPSLYKSGIDWIGMGTLLKANTGWILNSGTDVYGFAGMGAGYYDWSDGIFDALQETTYMWTATNGGSSAYYKLLFHNEDVFRTFEYSGFNNYKASIRCLAD
jgi:uncharacterized protein (TIGR02145 family)